MTIFYTDHAGTETQYQCMLSGRKEFDMTEGSNKCRWLVQQGHARLAVLTDHGTLVTQWERNAVGESVKIVGPDV